MLGRPSAALADRIHADEAARVCDQQERLGDDGLAECARALEDARRELAREVPRETVEAFAVPELERIAWIDSLSAREGPGARKVLAGARDGEAKEDTDWVVVGAMGAAVESEEGDIVGDAELVKHIASDDALPPPVFIQYDHVKVRNLLAFT